MTEGLSNRAVADQLFLSPHTVNSHVRHVFAKPGVSTRVELTRLASTRKSGGDTWSTPGS